MSDELFLGLDASTQALKASLLRDDLSVEAEMEVRFDRDLPHYKTQGGTLLGPQGSGIVYSPVMIVVEAMDMLFDRCKEANWPLHRVRGVSAAGQQHASVYWSNDAESILGHVRADKCLAEQMQGAFSRDEIPNWQDSSTLDECAALEREIGGADRLAQLTGSKAHTRFTGPQIMRFRRSRPDAYANTRRISLVSSFVTTLLCLDGTIKGIDESDACGMNMWTMNTAERGWSMDVLRVIAGGEEEAKELANKLGNVEHDGGRAVGRIGTWFVNRYGMSPKCVVCPGTGDNPATFLSFTLREKEGLFSLGTSDTILISTSAYNPDPQFHAFFHPAQIVHPSGQSGSSSMRYFNMLVYKNGSLAREYVRDRHFDKSWDKFNAAVEEARPTNVNDKLTKTGFWWLKPDIIPTNAEGVFKYEEDKLVDEFSSSNDNAFAMLNSQLLNYRSRSSAILTNTNSSQQQLPDQTMARVFATGGAAANPTICRMMADVLDCDVCKPVEFDTQKGVWQNVQYNACSVAAAYKAAWSWSRFANEADERLRVEPFDTFVQRAAKRRGSARRAVSNPKQAELMEIVEEGVAVIAKPDQVRAKVYSNSVEWWQGREALALQESQRQRS